MFVEAPLAIGPTTFPEGLRRETEIDFPCGYHPSITTRWRPPEEWTGTEKVTLAVPLDTEAEACTESAPSLPAAAQTIFPGPERPLSACSIGSVPSCGPACVPHAMHATASFPSWAALWKTKFTASTMSVERPFVLTMMRSASGATPTYRNAGNPRPVALPFPPAMLAR